MKLGKKNKSLILHMEFQHQGEPVVPIHPLLRPRGDGQQGATTTRTCLRSTELPEGGSRLWKMADSRVGHPSDHQKDGVSMVCATIRDTRCGGLDSYSLGRLRSTVTLSIRRMRLFRTEEREGAPQCHHP